MKTVLVVGAGPAGMFAAKKIAQAGHQVIILNRDIKPGGLAEYGIYPVKDKMKGGLRKQFSMVLAMPNVQYFGHISVGSEYAISVDELRQFNPDAMVFAVGAQGTKKLGLPGEDFKGVYSAKDFVYFYNQLPPFSTGDFSTRKRVAIVGMGNVMVDIARWLLQDTPNCQTEEVIVVARRGPLEAKFDEREIAYVQAHMEREAFQKELDRIKDKLTAVGQDPAQVYETTFKFLSKGSFDPGLPRLSFRFLCSPKAIHAGPDGRIERITVTENILAARDGGTAAKATDQTAELDVDTMIFAIGDVHDPKLGLPIGPEGYVTKPDPSRPESLYEVVDPKTGTVMEGIYVVGWARKASEGLVGIARHDAEVGAGHVLKCLEGVPDKASLTPEDILRRLKRKPVQVVTKEDLNFLAKTEETQAKKLGLSYFKFSDDEAMLEAIEEEKAKVGGAAATAD
jgi:ferredoxin--NADP+ reductase